jgi:hypothetical protein
MCLGFAALLCQSANQCKFFAKKDPFFQRFCQTNAYKRHEQRVAGVGDMPDYMEEVGFGEFADIIWLDDFRLLNFKAPIYLNEQTSQNREKVKMLIIKESVAKLKVRVVYWLKQLLPLRYETKYRTSDDDKYKAVWHMWFGKVFACQHTKLI